MTSWEIGERLVISPATVRSHVSNILDQRGIRRRSEAAAFAAEVGLTPRRV